MTVLWITCAVLVLLTGLLARVGHRMLTSGEGRSSGAADALGNFIDVFDPARARADRDLESRRHAGDVLPSPDDDDDRPVHVDLRTNRARVRRRT